MLISIKGSFSTLNSLCLYLVTQHILGREKVKFSVYLAHMMFKSFIFNLV